MLVRMQSYAHSYVLLMAMQEFFLNVFIFKGRFYRARNKFPTAKEEAISEK